MNRGECAAARDQFVCRREGHKPMVTVTHVSGPLNSFLTTCRVCGKWFEVDTEAK